MSFLFFKIDDLKLKDHSMMKPDFNSTDDFLKFENRERKRVEGYIDKIKDKRIELIDDAVKAAARRQKLESRKREQLEKLNLNEKRLKKLEEDFLKEEREVKMKLEKDEKERAIDEAERKKRWEQDANEWDKVDRERSVHALSGVRHDKSTLSKSFYTRNKSLAELKVKAKPRIENLSVLMPRSKEYNQAHFKIRKLKDIMQLSEQSQHTMRAKQLKELEFIVNTELNIKKKQEEKERIFQQKIESDSRKMGYKLQRHEQKLEKLEQDRILKIKRLHFERQQKAENIERAQRTIEYQIQAKQNKLLEDEEQFQEMKQKTEQYKLVRNQFRQQLLEDMDKLKTGEMQLEELNLKLKSQIQGEDGAESLGTFSPVSRRSLFSESLNSKKQIFRRLMIMQG